MNIAGTKTYKSLAKRPCPRKPPSMRGVSASGTEPCCILIGHLCLTVGVCLNNRGCIVERDRRQYHASDSTLAVTVWVLAGTIPGLMALSNMLVLIAVNLLQSDKRWRAWDPRVSVLLYAIVRCIDFAFTPLVCDTWSRKWKAHESK